MFSYGKPEQIIEQTVELLVIWDALHLCDITVIMYQQTVPKSQF